MGFAEDLESRKTANLFSLVVLASTSPRRAELLHAAGISFRVQAADVRELESHALPPRDLCLANADLKAQAVATRHPTAVVIGADTVVALPEETLGKPSDRSEARTMLEKLAGRTHEVLTGVCILHQELGKACRFVEVTRVTFRPASEIDFDAYLDRVDPLDKAGAYAAQEDHDALIESMDGSLSNVIGLPVERLREVLQNQFEPSLHATHLE